jgi:hypothetical protein
MSDSAENNNPGRPDAPQNESGAAAPYTVINVVPKYVQVSPAASPTPQEKQHHQPDNLQRDNTPNRLDQSTGSSANGFAASYLLDNSTENGDVSHPYAFTGKTLPNGEWQVSVSDCRWTRSALTIRCLPGTRMISRPTHPTTAIRADPSGLLCLDRMMNSRRYGTSLDRRGWSLF